MARVAGPFRKTEAMSTTEAKPQGQQIIPMRVLVRGRVDGTRMHEKTRYTRVLTPAPDPYSRPQIIEIRSKGQVGAKGEDIAVFASLGGYTRKPFKTTDKDTGEVLNVTPVDMTLGLVE